MIDSRNTIRLQPAYSAQPESSIHDNAPIDLTESTIRARAYELYELRGRTDGYAEQDWYQAEGELAANKVSETKQRKTFSKGA